MIIQILRDPDLYRRVRAEVMASNAVKELEGKTYLDMDKLISLPLLLSVHLECLRLYTSVPITRSLRTDVEIDGHKLSAGNYVIAPSYLAHTNERTWSTPSYPASTFWAERFIQRKDTEETNKHAPGDFFPYGGGLNLCPGRHIGKQEIFAAIALLLVKFDFEFVGYVDKKGRPTSKGPEAFNFEAHESRGVIQPNHDVLVRMRKARMNLCLFSQHLDVT
jgi:cytochrome P450